MPDTTLHKLTDLKCQKAKLGRHSDGGGLYLNVKPTGARSWLFGYRWGERRPSIGFGGYPTVSLQDARRRAGQCREWLASVPKKDPKVEWRKLSAPTCEQETFGNYALKHIDAIKGDFRNAKHTAQWRSTLQTHAARLWEMPLDQIGVDEVLSCLEPIWATRNETARRVRGRIEAVLESARVRGLRDDPNPAAWNGQLKHVLGKKRPPVKHFPALEYDRMSIIVKLQQALVCEIVFPGVRARKPLSDMTLTKVLRDMDLRTLKDEPVTVHGFRSCFSDWARNETDFPRELIEESLAHTAGKVEAAYRRGAAIERRRELMEAWAVYITRPNVLHSCAPTNV